MDNSVSIEISQQQLDELDKLLGPDNVLKAIYWAIKKTLAQSRTKIIRRIQEVLNMRRGTIAEAVKTWDPTSYQNLSGTVSIRRRKTSPRDLLTKLKMSGGTITAKIRKDKGPLVIGQGAAFHFSQTHSSGETFDGFLYRAKNLPTKSGFGKDHVGKLGKRGEPISRILPSGLASKYALHAIRTPAVLTVLGEDGESPVGKLAQKDVQAIFEKVLSSQIDRFLQAGITE